MGKQHLSRDDRIFMRGKLQGTRENMDMVAMALMDKCGWHVFEETSDSRDTHSIAEESRLSQILEANPLPKYNLTAKACLGILRRAERRGKDLPERLKAVLIRQSQGASPQERTEAPAPTEAPTSYAVRIRGAVTAEEKAR